MTTNRRISGCIFLWTLMAIPSPAFGSDDGPSCAEKSVVASAVQTRDDVRAFVQCAYEYAIEMGPEEARRAFNEDERWKSGSIYVFISESTPESDQAHHFVFPPEPEREGTSRGLLIDVFGNDYYKEQHRITSGFGEGWLYYSFTNFATGRDEPKASYVKSIDWNGTPAGIGAGIYLRDIPGSCNREEVNATELAANPSDRKLQEFVRCAAMEMESMGFFALHQPVIGPALETGLGLCVRCGRQRQHAVQRGSLPMGRLDVGRSGYRADVADRPRRPERGRRLR